MNSLGALMLGCIVLGCGREPEAQPYVVTEGGGGRSVEFHLDRLTERYRLAAEPFWAVGADERSRVLFGSVRTAARVSDSMIVAVDGRSMEIFIVARTGEVTVAGGVGGGPAEFRSIGSVHPRGDSRIDIFDTRMDRVVTLDLDGNFIEATAVLGASSEAQQDHYLPMRDGSYVVVNMRALEATELGVHRTQGAVLHVRGEQVDTIGSVPGPAYAVSEAGMGSVPFGATTVVASGRLGVWIGDQSEPRLVFRPLEEGAPLTVQWDGGPDRSVTDERMNEFMENALAAVPDLDEPAKKAFEEYVGSMELPEYSPAFDRILSDGEGGVWVGDYPGPLRLYGIERPPSQTWFHLSGEGVPTGTLQTSVGFQPLQFGTSWVLGRFRDLLDVESVRLYEMQVIGRSGAEGGLGLVGKRNQG